MHNPESSLENHRQKGPGHFVIQNGSPNLSKTTRPSDSQQRRQTAE